MDKSTKKILLDVFVIKKEKKILDLGNYLQVIEYGHKVRCYEKNGFLDEIRDLEYGDYDWFSKLSSRCCDFLNKYFYKKYFIDTDEMIKKFSNDNFNDDEDDENFSDLSNEIDVVESNDYLFLRCVEKIEKFKEEVIENFEDDYYLEKNDLKEEYKNQLYFKGKVESDKMIELKVFIFAFEEEREDLLQLSDNLLDISNQAFFDYVFMRDNLPLSTSRKIKLSVSRTINSFLNLCRCNADRFKYFITLTFANISEKNKHGFLDNKNKLKIDYVDNIYDYDSCVKALQKFLKKIKINLVRKYNIDDMAYIGVPEYHSNGAIHYHFLFTDLPNDCFYKISDWLDYDYLKNKKNNGDGLKYWSYGKSDVQVISDKARITSYLSKYMVKSLSEIDNTIYLARLEKNRYYCSRNLNKPIEIDYFNIDDYDIYSINSKTKYNPFYECENIVNVYQIKKLNMNDEIIRYSS